MSGRDTGKSRRREDPPVLARSIWDDWAQAAAARRGADASLALLASQVKDWSAWVSGLRKEGLAAAVWQAACEAGVQSIFPADAAGTLEGEAVAHLRLKQAVREAAGAAGRVLDGARIEWMLRGLPGHTSMVPEPGKRCGAARLLLREDARTSAERALADAGWQAREGGLLERNGHRVRVETGVLEVWPLNEADWLWERPGELDLGRYRVRTPGPAQAAAIRCLEAFFENGCWQSACLLDVTLAAGVLDRRGLEDFARVAHECGAGPEIALTLDVAARRQGLRVPATLTTGLVSRAGGLRVRAALLALHGGEAERAVHLLLTAPDGACRDSLVEGLLQRRGRGGPGALQLIRGLVRVLLPFRPERCLQPGG